MSNQPEQTNPQSQPAIDELSENQLDTVVGGGLFDRIHGIKAVYRFDRENGGNVLNSAQDAVTYGAQTGASLGQQGIHSTNQMVGTLWQSQMAPSQGNGQ